MNPIINGNKILFIKVIVLKIFKKFKYSNKHNSIPNYNFILINIDCLLSLALQRPRGVCETPIALYLNRGLSSASVAGLIKFKNRPILKYIISVN